MKTLYLLLFLSVFWLNSVDAQEIEFGEISLKELEEQRYAPDQSANAVILYKRQKTYFNLTNGVSL